MFHDSFIMPKFNDSTIEYEYIGDPLKPFVEDFLAICWFVNFAWLIYSGTEEIMCSTKKTLITVWPAPVAASLLDP